MSTTLDMLKTFHFLIHILKDLVMLSTLLRKKVGHVLTIIVANIFIVIKI